MATERSTLVTESRVGSRALAHPLARLGTPVWYVVLSLLAVIFVFPFFWAASSSLKQISELYDFPPSLLPAVPQWSNYATVMESVPYLLWVKNSATVVVLVTCGVLLTASVVAYSFARFEYRGRTLLFLITLATMMFPAQITLIPQFLLFNALGWVNTLRPLWVPAWFGGGAFYIFLLRQFMLSLPPEYDEAALIDGASYVQIFWRILLPLCRPALATAAVIAFIGSWDDFLTPLIYVNTEAKFTVAVGLNYFRNVPETAGVPMQNLLMAASVMAVFPPIVVFLLAQRYFTEGIVLSGIKG